MSKILIAINNDFIRETYKEVFINQGLEVFITNKGNEVLELAKNKTPDIIILDIALAEIKGLELLETLKKENITKKIPVIVFAQFERKEEKLKAIELNAKDFITATDVTPAELIAKVKIILGGQKSYRVAIKENLQNAKELLKDLGYNTDNKCPKCGKPLVLYLIKDLSKGPDYFKASFVCLNCYQK